MEAPIVTIAHLSDLHCDGSLEWKRRFEHLSSTLSSIAPDIVVVTGDAVDTPKSVYFSELSACIAKLSGIIEDRRKATEKKGEFYWITIPGNHDLHASGTRWLSGLYKPINLLLRAFKSPIAHCDFFGEQTRLCWPMESIDTLCTRIFKDYQILLFPFDSNGRDPTIAWAEGNVEDAAKTFGKYNEIYENLSQTTGELISRRIAILHHHPLPLPTEKHDRPLEGMLILRNSYTFLHEAAKHNIDLILHGHKHVASEARYRTSLDSPKSLIVLSCGTSAKATAKQNDFNVYTISPSGAIELTIYKSDGAVTSAFRSVRDSKIAVDYGAIRKHRCCTSSVTLGNNHNSSPAVIKIAAKSKIVKIESNGNALVSLTMEGIDWGPNNGKKYIKEYIIADFGRVSYGWSVLCSEGEHYNIRSENELYWTNPLHYPWKFDRPKLPENFWLEVKPHRTLDRTQKSYCEIRYHLFNGYALTRQDFMEMYGGHRFPKEQEVCTIESDYPTELLELVVKFPSKEFFPSRDGFVLEPWLKASHNPSEPAVLRGDYYKHAEEDQFLIQNHAIRYRKDLLEVAVVIRHPQPGVAYTLRWKLPQRLDNAKLTPGQEATARTLQELFCNPHNQEVGSFYKNLSDDILKIFSSDPNSPAFYVSANYNKNTLKNDLEVLLLGYNTKQDLHTITCAPARFNGAAPFSIGRGVAGAAFKGRTVAYWEDTSETGTENSLLTQPPEQIIKNYKPGFVLALPLSYPQVIKEVWEKMEREGISGKCPIFAIVVIAGKSKLRGIRGFNPTRSQPSDEDIECRKRILTGLYAMISERLEEDIPNYFNTNGLP